MIQLLSGRLACKLRLMDEPAQLGFEPAPRQPWSRPLRIHLSFIIVALLIAVSAPLLWLTYANGKAAALEAAQEQMELLSQRTIDLYEGVFREGQAVLTVASVLPSLAEEPTANLEAKTRVMLRELKGSPNLDGVYVGYPSGSFVQMIAVKHNVRWLKATSAPEGTVYAMRSVIRNTDGQASSAWRFLDENGALLGEQPRAETTYDPRTRPWYRAAEGKGALESLGPYVSASTNSLTFTLAHSLEASGSGVVGADMLLEHIANTLAEQAVSEHSVAYLFDDEGRLIVHSDPAFMAELTEHFVSPSRRGSSFSIADPVLPVAARLVAEDSDDRDGLMEFTANGEPYIARLSRLGTSSEDLARGSVVIAAPLDDFTGPSLHTLYNTLAIAAALVTMGLLLSVLIARLISRSLIELSEDARRIGDLNFEGRRQVHSHITEINLLSVALTSARQAIRTFALYVPRELVRKIVASGQAQVSQATRQEVTALFTDVKDFTTISERLPPEQVVEMLGVYFQHMNEVVERHGGVILQYLGDSIHAMWNAPIEHPDHVDAACRCTLELKATIDELNESNARSDKPQFITRYGVHTGVAVVGSVGAAERRQYTAMGDTINVASRLEGMNKQFGTSILVSAAVRDSCRHAFLFRELGRATAKGRTESIEVFELVSEVQSEKTSALPQSPKSTN